MSQQKYHEVHVAFADIFAVEKDRMGNSTMYYVVFRSTEKEKMRIDRECYDEVLRDLGLYHTQQYVLVAQG